MADDAPRALICLIEGESSLFIVKAAGSSLILGLNDLIEENAKNGVLNGVDAKDLTLWKVDLAFPQENDLKGLIGKDVPGSVRLNAIDYTSYHWPATMPPKPEHLHIIVELPSAPVLGKRSRAAYDLPWLEELHSEIWSREDLRPQLFRKELHSDRDSPDYNGNKPAVLGVKLNFLQSLTQVDDDYDMEARSEDDDSEAMNEDDTESQLSFPSILGFLDLSTLKLKEDLPIRFPLPLLLREEYKKISELIENHPQNSGGSVIISGQSGTGKTSYLYLRIIENMIEGRTFLYQDIEGTVYHVSEKGVETVRSWSSKESIVAFVDGDKENFEPDKILLRHSVQLIVAASPMGANQKWTEQIGDGSYMTKLAIKLWSREELLLTGIFLHRTDHTFKLMRDSMLYLGCNPRQCLSVSSFANLDYLKSELECSIRAVAANRSDEIIRLLRDTRTGASDIYQIVFQVFPSDPNRLYSNCQLETVSPWALDLLLRHCEDHKADVIANFY